MFFDDPEQKRFSSARKDKTPDQENHNSGLRQSGLRKRVRGSAGHRQPLNSAESQNPNFPEPIAVRFPSLLRRVQSQGMNQA